MRYRLRTLLIVLALGPPVIAGAAYIYRLDDRLLWGPLALGLNGPFSERAMTMAMTVVLIAGMSVPLITRSVPGALAAITSSALWLLIAYGMIASAAF